MPSLNTNHTYDQQKPLHSGQHRTNPAISGILQIVKYNSKHLQIYFIKQSLAFAFLISMLQVIVAVYLNLMPKMKSNV